jgi:hypothetical protein
MTLIKSTFVSYLFASIHLSIIGFLYGYLHPLSFKASFHISVSVFIAYNFMRILKIQDFEKIQANRHLLWISKNLTEIVFALVFAILYWVIGISEIENKFLWGFLALLSIVYVRARSIFVIKNVIIGLVWALIPWVYSNQISVLWTGFFFIYITWLSIIYDEKDAEKLSEKSFLLKKIGYILVCISILFFFLETKNSMLTAIFAVFQMILILFFRKPKKYETYLFIIDLWILVPFIKTL